MRWRAFILPAGVTKAAPMARGVCSLTRSSTSFPARSRSLLAGNWLMMPSELVGHTKASTGTWSHGRVEIWMSMDSFVSAATSVLKHGVEFLGNHGFRGRLDSAQFADDEIARGLEHLTLPMGQVLGRLQEGQVAVDLADLEEGAGADLLHETAVAAVPGLAVAGDLVIAQEIVEFVDHAVVGEGAHAILLGLGDGDDDLEAGALHP